MKGVFRMPWSNGNMMFGLTSSHAAGSIAIVMVGMKLQTTPGEYLVDSDMLNAVVIMILFTCVFGSMMTDNASQKITLTEGLASESEERRREDSRAAEIGRTDRDADEHGAHDAQQQAEPRTDRSQRGV